MVPAVLDRCCFVGAILRDSSHHPRMAVSADDGDGYGRLRAGGPNAFVAVWVGFIGAIFGGLALRRLQGLEPEHRGRAWALFATAGIRGLLMVIGGTLGSVVLGRGGEEGVIRSFSSHGGLPGSSSPSC